MKNIKYRTGNRWIRDGIEAFEVISETKHQITYLENGSEYKQAKDSELNKWHDTLEDAKNFVEKRCQEEIEEAQKTILFHQGIINKL